MSIGPSASRAAAMAASVAAGVGQVDVDGRHPAAVAGDVVGDRVQRVGAAVEHGDGRALVGEQVGGGPAHPAGGAGDDGHLALDRAAELGEARHGP